MWGAVCGGIWGGLCGGMWSKKFVASCEVCGSLENIILHW